MTVNELIERLKQYNANTKVYFIYFNDDDDNNVITFETDTVGIVDNNDHIVIDLLDPEPYKKNAVNAKKFLTNRKYLL